MATVGDKRTVASGVPAGLARRFLWAAKPLLITVALLAVATIGVSFAGLYWADHVARQRAREVRSRVRVGMTVPEVQHIASGAAAVTPVIGGASGQRVLIHTQVGLATYEVVVHLDSQGRVTVADEPEYASD